MSLTALVTLAGLLAAEPMRAPTMPSESGAPGDTLRFAATRTADSVAVAECVQRVVVRYGFSPLANEEVADAKVVGRRWSKLEADGVTATELHTSILVKADSITVPARIERKNVNATVAMVGVGVLQVSAECRRARTPDPRGDNMG
jgi:hypothetical protein